MQEFVEKKLSNGITVYYYSDKKLKRVYASINVNYGTDGFYDKFIYDDKEFCVRPAIAHFLEHYLIETSKNGNMLLRYRDKSYSTNGITYPDLTTYYFIGIDSKNNINKSLLELVAMIEEPVFNDENVENVKKAICQELINAEDNRYQIARCNNRHNLHVSYDPVPVNNNVLGSVETTSRITLEEIKACYDAYYNDDNKYIIIAGNIDIDKIHKMLNGYYKDRRHANLLKDFPYGLDIGVRKKLEIINLPTDAEFVTASLKIPIDPSISLLEHDYYLELFFREKLKTSNPKVQKLINENYVIGGISSTCDYFNSCCDITISYESHKAKSSLKLVEDLLSDKEYKKDIFELEKKDYLVSQVRKSDNIYRVFTFFPMSSRFSKVINLTDTIKAFNYKKFKDYISKIDFKFETATIISKKRIRK